MQELLTMASAWLSMTWLRVSTDTLSFCQQILPLTSSPYFFLFSTLFNFISYFFWHCHISSFIIPLPLLPSLFMCSLLTPLLTSPFYYSTHRTLYLIFHLLLLYPQMILCFSSFSYYSLYRWPWHEYLVHLYFSVLPLYICLSSFLFYIVILFPTLREFCMMLWTYLASKQIIFRAC